ncbi:FAD-dependent pyridine nucleotide-disulfide oxidoreductase [Xylogone sp. PMI_703]|nr:FAD-dependent pyridine nucleotide-disulfide oxidoreductase [Xylogone sp. PMI_703]
MAALAPHIVIVGGVAGGMSAATRARRLCESARITVFEKGPFVSYANCGIPYALGGIIENEGALVLQTPESFKVRYNIDVYIQAEVTAIDRASKKVTVKSLGNGAETVYPYDKLILSQGLEAARLSIEGANLPQVFTLQTIDDMRHIKLFISKHKSQKAVIIGGGFIGLEAAENLVHLGLNVTIIESTSHVFPQVDDQLAGPIHAELRRHSINVLLNTKVQKIEKDEHHNHMNIILENAAKLSTDIILMAVGGRPKTALAESAGLVLGKRGVAVNKYMQTSDPDIYAAGDMAETENRIAKAQTMTALAGPANRQGRLAADHIFGREVSYRGNVGASICKVFDMTIGSTGLPVHALRALGRAVEWVTVHPPDHAGYYPRSSMLSLRVIFDPDTGLLLGAQAVGKQGVDKRIDVLSTAIQAGMTIFDLEHLELAYAPPYGAAKDPVNMAGFVGSNVLRGDTRIVHPEDLRNIAQNEELQIVDVRSSVEFSSGQLPRAINLPLPSLRESLHALDKGKKVLVYCRVGYRAYVACRILSQLGFDVVNLDGGLTSVQFLEMERMDQGI